MTMAGVTGGEARRTATVTVLFCDLVDDFLITMVRSWLGCGSEDSSEACSIGHAKLCVGTIEVAFDGAR